jgi:hypothetical protein
MVVRSPLSEQCAASLARALALLLATTPTASRAGRQLPDAMRLLRTETGTRFCPGTVAALERCMADDPSLRRYFGERVGDVPYAA